jgi:hypothetical protein
VMFPDPITTLRAIAQPLGHGETDAVGSADHCRTRLVAWLHAATSARLAGDLIASIRLVYPSAPWPSATRRSASRLIASMTVLSTPMSFCT